MTKVLSFKPRNAEVRAMRIIIGETTRKQIQDFAPQANVGIPTPPKGGTVDYTDIRWVVVSNGLDHEPAEMMENGEWLVQRPDGQYEFMSDTAFHTVFEAAE